MKINLRTSSIKPMLGFLRNLRDGQANRKQLCDILNHPDYDFEFRRYGIGSKDPLVDYFMQINSIHESAIPELHSERKNMLKYKHKRWIEACENPEQYEVLLEKVSLYFTEKTFENISAWVSKGLPPSTELDDIQIISTMSIGTSFGYVYDGSLHFDLMGFDNDSMDTLPSLIAHEIHHLALWKYATTFTANFSLEERYIFTFSGEGLAIKFCNNAKGVISKEIDDTRPANDGLDKFSMNYLNEHFYEALRVFEDTLIHIRAGRMSKDDVNKQLEEYWWNPYTEDQNHNEEPLLKHSLVYSFGNDVFGTIYDVFGLDTLYECIRHPLKTIKYFELATKQILYS